MIISQPLSIHPRSAVRSTQESSGCGSATTNRGMKLNSLFIQLKPPRLPTWDGISHPQPALRCFPARDMSVRKMLSRHCTIGKKHGWAVSFASRPLTLKPSYERPSFHRCLSFTAGTTEGACNERFLHCLLLASNRLISAAQAHCHDSRRGSPIQCIGMANPGATRKT